ncbi:ABC transporter substrate-binding protein [uncultured Roseibium sp.]|uniref:ABC transporter substrate-binding protein n=1 Tax=uncultured Roseibium sp. TaxID=1936171 RepID=UPI002628BB1E|nr:ABC transporter substrate-binding protein [uncultured Roseibium sp.]
MVRGALSKCAGFLTGMILMCHSVAAQEVKELKVGFMATLSGPAAVFGKHMHDGFMLAVNQSNGALGGMATKIFVVDDKLDPDLAVEEATKLINEYGIDVLVGVNFSRVMLAVHDPVVRSKTVFIGTHSGPAPIAGRNCSRYFFSTAPQDDQVHETMGRYASLKGYQRVVTIAPDYEAARDSIAAFRRHFKGQIAREIFPKLGQTGFSTEFDQIAEIDPDAIYAFMPGGMGIELVRQFQTSGLKGIIPFLSSRTVNAVTLPHTMETGEGLFSASHWAPNLDNPANKRFVREFSRAYDYAPSVFAAQGYDAAKLIHYALELTGGAKDQEALISAINAAPFESVRGDFRFNSNQFPIQDFYLVEGVRRTSRLYEMEAIARVFDDVGDAFSGSCRL